MAAFCQNYGTPLNEGTEFCPGCGAAVAAPAPAQQNVTQSQLAPIGQIFAIAGIGANIKDLAASGKDIWKNGYNSLDAKSKEELAMNSFGVISYGAGAINDYVNGGSIMSGTFTKGDDGVSAVYHTEEEFDVDGEHYKSAIDMKGNKIKEERL